MSTPQENSNNQQTNNLEGDDSKIVSEQTNNHNQT